MHAVFEDWEDAGKTLAKKLERFRGSNALILAIPRGGVLVAAAAAHRLGLEWNIILARKLPVPWNPESGFGAVTADGSVVLNEPMVHGLQIKQSKIDAIVAEVREEVVCRTEAYSREKPPPEIAGRDVIVLDDGLASGYTMLASIKSVRAHSPSKVIAASPVASRSAAKLVEGAADECVFEVLSPSVPFAVADFYLAWHDLTDEDVIAYLRKVRDREGMGYRL